MHVYDYFFKKICFTQSKDRKRMKSTSKVYVEYYGVFKMYILKCFYTTNVHPTKYNITKNWYYYFTYQYVIFVYYIYIIKYV